MRGRRSRRATRRAPTLRRPRPQPLELDLGVRLLRQPHRRQRERPPAGRGVAEERRAARRRRARLNVRPRVRRREADAVGARVAPARAGEHRVVVRLVEAAQHVVRVAITQRHGNRRRAAVATNLTLDTRRGLVAAADALHCDAPRLRALAAALARGGLEIEDGDRRVRLDAGIGVPAHRLLRRRTAEARARAVAQRAAARVVGQQEVDQRQIVAARARGGRLRRAVQRSVCATSASLSARSAPAPGGPPASSTHGYAKVRRPKYL